MSRMIDLYIETLDRKAKGAIRGTAKLVIADVGNVLLDENGAREGNEAADVVLIASHDVFTNILSGDQNPITAFMSGKLKVEGNTKRALKVSSILTD